MDNIFSALVLRLQTKISPFLKIESYGFCSQGAPMDLRMYESYRRQFYNSEKSPSYDAWKFQTASFLILL